MTYDIVGGKNPDDRARDLKGQRRLGRVTTVVSYDRIFLQKINLCRNTPSGGLVGAAPLGVASVYCHSPFGADSAPGGEHLRGVHRICFADSLQAKARARHRLDSGLSESRELGGWGQARWLTAPGRLRLCRWELASPILFSMSVRLLIGAAKKKAHLPSSIFCYGVLRVQCANPLVQ